MGGGLRTTLRASGSLRVLGSRGTAAIAVTSALGRLPVSMASLALLLSLAPGLGLRSASVASGAFGVGFAVLAPVKGRWIDRRGPRGALRVLAMPSTAALLWIAAGQPGAVLVVLLAGIAGATMPPVAPATRALWVRRFPQQDLRHGAMALDAVISELAIVGGSAAVSLLAAAGGRWALVTTAVLTSVGAWAFSGLPAVGHWSTRRSSPGASAPPADRRALALLAVQMSLVPAGIGAVIVGLTQLGDAVGGPGSGGWLVTATAAGSVVSSVLVTTVPQQTSHALPRIWRRVAGFTVAFAVLLTPLIVVRGYAPLVGLSVLAYLCVAPVFVGQAEILGRLAPAGRENEVFALGPTTNWVGQSAGIVVMGVAVNAAGLTLALVLPPLILVLAAAVAASGGRRQPSTTSLPLS